MNQSGLREQLSSFIFPGQIRCTQIQCGSSSAGKIMIVCVPLPSSTYLVFKEHGSFFVTVEEMESVLCPRLPEMMAYSHNSSDWTGIWLIWESKELLCIKLRGHILEPIRWWTSLNKPLARIRDIFEYIWGKAIASECFISFLKSVLPLRKHYLVSNLQGFGQLIRVGKNLQVSITI